MATHSSILARDGGAWWAAVYGVSQSRTPLKSKVTPHHQLLLSTAPTWESLEKGMEGAAQTAIASPSWSHALRDARFAGVCVLGGDPWDSLAFAPLGQPLSLRPRATFLPTTVPPSSGKRQPK